MSAESRPAPGGGRAPRASPDDLEPGRDVAAWHQHVLLLLGAQQQEHRLLRLLGRERKSSRPFSISVGTVTRGAKLSWSILGAGVPLSRPPARRMLALNRFSRAVKFNPSCAPQLNPSPPACRCRRPFASRGSRPSEPNPCGPGSPGPCGRSSSAPARWPSAARYVPL